SRFAGTSGSFGGAGGAEEAAGAPAGAAGGPLIAGAVALLAVVFAGTSGFAAAFVIFGGALSTFPAGPGFTVLALAFVAAEPASAGFAIAGSVCGVGAPPSNFGGVAFFFAPAGVSVFPACVDGMMDSILSFSISSYPKSVLILNMLSS